MSQTVPIAGSEHARRFTALPPLSLYIHLPWCVRKCPYCDFNSHEAREEIPEQAYIDALLDDLAMEMPLVWGRQLVSIFIGGGTPSLFSAASLDRLLCGVRALTAFGPDIEITLEANPGTIEQARFDAYRAIGINRLSIGVQSLDDRSLAALGRIHSAAEARRAVEVARRAGFERLNLDLMYGLPDQAPADAAADLDALLALEPSHVSCYELTLEPNTAFAAHPPPVPDDETRWDMQAALLQRLRREGFDRYEISAFARPGQQSVHNLNYWRFGDYIGIGAGAHGKLSFADSGLIRRRSRVRHPKRYLAAIGEDRIATDAPIPLTDTGLEFMMNALRLVDGVERTLFEQHAGTPLRPWSAAIDRSIDDALLQDDPTRIAATERGLDLLNELLSRFMPEAHDSAPTAHRVIPLTPV